VGDALCNEKYRLLDELKKLIREYMLSVQTMTAAVGTSEFYTALEKCQRFRAAMYKLKQELKDHSLTHHCS